MIVLDTHTLMTKDEKIRAYEYVKSIW